MNLTRRDWMKHAAAFGATAMIGGRALADDAALPTTAPALLMKTIPATGETLPVIGLGTWQTFDVADDATAPLKDVLRLFSELGGQVVDSSPMYGRSEKVLGDLAAQLGIRGKLFVATKVWTRGKRAGFEQMNDSLKKLRADPIDLMQVHNLIDVEAHFDTLRGWKRDGRIKYLGVTHYTASAHDAVAKVIEQGGIDFIQINYSVSEREAADRLLPLAKDCGVAVIANRPLVGGALLKRLAGKPLPPIAIDLGCESWAQLLLKYVVSHEAVTCAIPATSKVAHLRDNMRAATGRLATERERAQIVEMVEA